MSDIKKSVAELKTKITDMYSAISEMSTKINAMSEEYEKVKSENEQLKRIHDATAQSVNISAAFAAHVKTLIGESAYNLLLSAAERYAKEHPL